MGSYKIRTQKTDLQSAISDGIAALQSLRDEVQEIVDNASGTNFENSQRIQTFSETADALSYADNEPTLPDELAEVAVEYSESYKRGHISRAVQCSNACAMLQAAVDALEAQEHDDASSIAGELEDIISNAEGAEFPGMYG